MNGLILPFSWWRRNEKTGVNIFCVKRHLDVKGYNWSETVLFSKSKLCSGFAEQTVGKGINFRLFISPVLLFEME